MTRAQLTQRLQHYWWLVGVLCAVAGSLGVSYTMPGPRLASIEAQNVRQDSLIVRQRIDFDRHVDDKQKGLDSLNSKITRLLNGTCLQQRSPMTRLAYGCQ